MIPTRPRSASAGTRPQSIFTPGSRADFAASYPEGAHRLNHELGPHPLLELEALAQLGEHLPGSSVEYNRGDVPVGLEGEAARTGLSIGDTIRRAETSMSWAVLKNVEQVPAYRVLLEELLGELRPIIEQRTGRLLKPQAFIFVSSPDAVTPYHFDPEHNICFSCAVPR